MKKTIMSYTVREIEIPDTLTRLVLEIISEANKKDVPLKDLIDVLISEYDARKWYGEGFE